MYTVKLTEEDMRAVIAKAGNRGAAVRDFLVSKSDQAEPVVETPVEPPPVPNATGTYGDRSKTVNQPSANAAVEGADAPGIPED